MGRAASTRSRRRGLIAATALALVLAAPALAQTPRVPAQPDPRDLNVDPRALPRPEFGQPARTGMSQGPAPLLPGVDPATAQPAAGGATTRRAPTRAQRPVRGAVSGAANRPVRATPRAVAALPPPPQAARPPGLRGSTIIATPAPDGLQDAGFRRPPRRAEDDPWAPVGLRLGTITVLPAITQSVGYDSNPNRTVGQAKGSAVSRTEGEIGLRSDWSTHRFTANLRAGYSAFPDQRDANRPDGAATAALQLNLGRDTDLDFDARAGLDTQRPGSTNFNFAVRERPNIYTAGVGAAVTQRFNRLSLSLRGAVDRTTYEDATDVGGNRIRQSDRDVTQYGLRLRAGYEVMPGVTPFIETLADQRVFDERADQSGFRRDSRSLALRAGSTFEVTRLITGEIAVGYQSRDFEDPRLKTLAGAVGEASLSWAVTPLTTVSLRGATDLNDTTIAGSSGSVNRRLGLEVAHALRRNWTVTGFATLNRNDFDRTRLTEDIWQVGLRTEYRLTRMVALRASFTHERLVSSAPRSDYTANTVLVGMRLQL